MFTRKFFISLAVCIVMATIGGFWHPMYVVTVIALIALGVSTILQAVAEGIALLRLTVSRDCPEQMSLNQPNQVDVTLRLHLPSWWSKYYTITTYDTVPASFRRKGESPMVGTGTHRYYVTPVSRGRYEFGAVRCMVDMYWFSLISLRRFVNINTVVRVYPTFRQLDKLEIMATSKDLKDGQKRMRRAGNNTEFDQIRAYVPGDDVRTINWRATARQASLMVNTYTDERSKPIISILCAGPSMLIATEGISLLDRAASAAVALASSSVRHYDEAGLITATHNGVTAYMKPERSPRTLARMLDYTYSFGLPPTPSEQEFVEDPDVLPEDIDEGVLRQIWERQDACKADADYSAIADFVVKNVKRRSTIMLFANFENDAIARLALPHLTRIVQKHNLVIVLFENEGVRAAADAYDSEGKEKSSRLSELRFRGVCSNYLERQKKLAEYIRKSGIKVIFTTPNNLSASVISTYLDMKNRGLI